MNRPATCLLAACLSCTSVAAASPAPPMADRPGPAVSLLWENRGQSDFEAVATDVAQSPHGIIVPGTAADDAGGQVWFVRGLDPRTGAVRWEDRFGPSTFGLAKDAEIEGRRGYVTGWILTPGLGFEFVVRAYELADGAVAWSRQIALGPDCPAESPGFARCVAKALDVDDGRVYAIGHLTRTANRSDFALLAFDARTGLPLWESVTDTGGTTGYDYGWAVRAAGSTVFALGENNDFSALQLQAHDARSGAILWQVQLPGHRIDTLKNLLATDGDRVYIAGGDDALRLFVHAYDARTGALLWADRAGAADGWSQATALTLDRGHGDGRGHGGARVVVTGLIDCDAVTGVDCELAVRAYDPRGGLAWARSDVAPGGDWGFITYNQAADGRSYVYAEALLDDGQYHGRLLGYDLHDGALELSYPLDDGSGAPPALANGIAAGPHRVLVGGLVIRPDGYVDVQVRLLGIRH